MRLIDADHFLKSLDTVVQKTGSEEWKAIANTMHYMIEVEVDLFPVKNEMVLCKDCKYSTHEPCDGYDNDYICNRTPFSRSEGGRMPEEFCSRGERKE